MRADRINIDSVDVPASRFDRIIEWLLISLLAFMPFAFGAVEAWSEEVVIILAAAISICFLLKLVVERDTCIVWSWAYVPVALFILVAAFQLVRLPTSLVGAVSPNTAATKSELLADLPNSGTLLESMTLSFYPNATRHDLRLVFAVAAVFFVTANVYRRPDQIKRLLGAVAIIGGSIAVLALAQDVLGNGKIYWTVPTGGDPARSGTFICHSHYDGVLEWPYPQGDRRSAAARLARLGDRDQFESIFYRYPLEWMTEVPQLKEEPVYSRDFLDLLFGQTEVENRSNSRSATFLDHRMFVNSLLVEPLMAVERDIRATALTDQAVARWIEEMDITYSFIRRDIAGTQTRSYHAYGLAVDLVPLSYEGKHMYWRWSRVHNREGWSRIPLSRRWTPPQAVVEAFERHGFVWGGKWSRFDNIHFEYRPEIILYNRMEDESGASPG